MRELLGGKGANVAEMTRVLGAERVPTGFTITTEACVRVHARRPHGARRPRRRGRRRAGGAGGARGQAARRRGRPAAGLGPLGRARVDARHDGHGPEPRAQRRVGRRARRADGQPALRVGRVPALRPDVRQRLPRDPRRGSSRPAIAERKAVRGREPTTSSSTEDDLRGLVDDFKAIFTERTGEEFPQDPAGPAARRRSAPCSTRGSASAPRPTGGSTTSPTTGAPPATCSRWCSATRATRRARASRSRATR